MEKEAMFYSKLRENTVQCQLCPHYCTIKPGERGKCKARENQNGMLMALVYGKPCSTALDPIEKKPFYHFYPGEKTLTIATVGCNLSCQHCQNWQISQADIESCSFKEMSPREIIRLCKDLKSRIISFSYTEPSVWYEYMLDIAKLARKDGIKTAMISNGFINIPPLKKLVTYIDAFNIDLKSIKEDFYENICGARLAPVLETIKMIYSHNKHLEITNLIIPGLNDKEEDITELVSWVRENLDENVVLHFSAFYPCYKLEYLPPTSPETIKKACEIAKKIGMKNVYSGNI